MQTISKIKSRYSYSWILLQELVRTEFKLKYQGSVLGYAWTLLRPLALFVVLYLVFVKFLRVGGDIPYFPIYLLLGIVLWNFFSDLTNGAIGSIVSRGDLIRKINFPKYIIVASTSISALINLGINLIIIFTFMVIFGSNPSVSAVVILPLSIGVIFLTGMGIGFILSALFVRLRDLNYIWEVIMQAGFYGTPILYPLQILPEYVQKILMLNPVAIGIQEARNTLITRDTITAYDLYGSFIGYLPLLITLTLVVFGALFFRSRSKGFAEEI
ncbi:ABC transporter permease [Candidatus Nomurabacteria bacterium]|nr:ABC transporter permease [Candidatus Nomurabacteria bacterium]